jgi:inhibitor of KinA
MVAAGDSALTIEFEERIDPLVNARAIALADAIVSAQLSGIRDVVPTYRSVTIYFDPLRTDYDVLVRRVERAARRPAPSSTEAGDPIEIPVCYDGDFGPDLAGVARLTGLTEAEVVRVHTEPTYRVFMLGFVPGFAYLGSVPERIAVPRHVSPRLRVAAGSVGIAGAQSGIYPAETPGGWQIVGRTPVRPFEVRRSDPFLMKPGDAVRFAPIDRREYHRLQAAD